nr:hypothetical protein [Tanacetum cinerariifolium]
MDSPSKFYMYPRFLQLIINAQIADLSSHNTKYTSPVLTQKVFANMRRDGKEFLGVDTPLFAEQEKVAQAIEITKLKQRVGRLKKKRQFKSSGLKRLKKGEFTKLDAYEDVTLEEVDAEVTKDVYHLDLEHAEKVLSMQETDKAEPAEVEEYLRQVLQEEKGGVIIQNPEEAATASLSVQLEVKSKDKGKGILVEEPKPLKRQAQIKQDEAFIRELEAELNANINWNEVIEQMKRKERFKMKFFKGMTYTNIRPIFEKHFNSIWAFWRKGDKKEESKRKSKNLEQKAAKKQKIDKEVEELKTHLQIIPNDEYDVYTEATPLALKYPLTRFTLEQTLNNVRLEVEEESEMSLELLSLGVDVVEDFKEYMLRDCCC